MASLFGLEKNLRNLSDELRPNIKDIPKEEKVEEPKIEKPKEEPVEQVIDESLLSEERNELDADERAAFDDKASNISQVENQAEMLNWEDRNNKRKTNNEFVNNRIPDIQNDFEKAKIILQGATNSNEEIGGALMWDANLAKIETPEDKAILRAAYGSLISSAAMFGKNSKLFAYLWEEAKSELSLSRSAQGFAAKMANTQITQSFVDKNVKTQRQGSGGTSGVFNSIQPGASPYG